MESSEHTILRCDDGALRRRHAPDTTTNRSRRWVAQVAASATCVPTAQEVTGNVALDSSTSSGFATPVGSKLPTGATQRHAWLTSLENRVIFSSVNNAPHRTQKVLGRARLTSLLEGAG